MLADFHPAYSIGVRCRLGYAEARPRATLPTLIDMYGRERCAARPHATLPTLIRMCCRGAAQVRPGNAKLVADMRQTTVPIDIDVRPPTTLPTLIYMHQREHCAKLP